MSNMVLQYNLKDFTNIAFNGFDFTLPETTFGMISELSLEVGSPTYIKTPVFKKRDTTIKNTNTGETSGQFTNYKKKRGGGKNVDMVTDEDWEMLRTFQTTKLEQKVGIDAQIDVIRSYLNKLSDKSYSDSKNNILNILNQLILDNISNEDMIRVGTAIFDIASNNRFFSKLYADLYTDLIEHYPIMKDIFDNNFSTFMELFDNIQYVDAEVNYDQFCKNNKINEKRKSLSAFFINLMKNNVIHQSEIKDLIMNLLNQISHFIKDDSNKNVVDELTENIAILYDKTMFENNSNEKYKINNQSILEFITELANSKVKKYPGLSNKTIFKFMDVIER